MIRMLMHFALAGIVVALASDGVDPLACMTLYSVLMLAIDVVTKR